MKTFVIDDVEIVFWFAGSALFCKIHDMGSEIYCCGDCQMPETEEDVLKVTEKAWVW